MKTGKSHIQSLIAQGESQYLDFKFEISDSRKIARSISAFSNTDGGILLIGVKDNGTISGIRSEEEIYMTEAAAKMYCKPAVPYIATTWIEKKKTVLELKIPKMRKQICYAQQEDEKWWAFIRVNDSNLIAPSIQLKIWNRRHANTSTHIIYTDKEKIILEYLSIHEGINIPEFCRIADIKRHTAEVVLVNLIMLGIIELFYHEQKVFFRLK